jgi:hypothetical protein
MKKKNNIFFLFYLILTTIFIFPVIYFGIKEVEIYKAAWFSNKIYNKDFFNPFIFFLDYYGPGVNFPLGNFAWLHPFSIFFSENLRLFYLVSGFFNIYIQLHYFLRSLKLLKIEIKYKLISLTLIFSISNFNYFWGDDWMSVFYTYTFFFPIVYYFLKIIKKKTILSYIQFGFFFGYFFVNSHPGIFFNICIFLIIFFLINNLFYLFKEKYFYICIIIFTFITCSRFYYLIIEYLKFGEDVKRLIQPSYNIKHYIASIFLPVNFSSVFTLDRYPTFGIILILGVFQAILILIKRESKKYFNLNIILLLLIILSATNILGNVNIVSGIWVVRDIVNIIGFIFFIIFLNNLKNKVLLKLFISAQILMIFFFYIGMLFYYIPINDNQNNIILTKKKNSDEFYEFTKKISPNIFENKTYLSPNFYKDIDHHKFNNYNIFDSTDLTNFNLSPFQGDFKNISMDNIQKSPHKMRGYLIPNIKEINNDKFLSIFNIKYVIIYKEEFNILETKSNFNIVSSLKIENKILYLLERKKFFNKVIIKENHLNNINCKNLELVECVIKYDKILTLNNLIKFKKIEKNNYVYDNQNNNKVLVIGPFVQDKNWHSSAEKRNFDGRLMIFVVPEKSEITLNYKDNNRFILTLISLISIFITILFIIYLKNNIIKKVYRGRT